MKKIKLLEKDGTVSVSRTVLRSGESVENQKSSRIEIRPFITDTATVSVKYGSTIPLEKYQSIRIDVMVSVPCYVEEIKDVYSSVRSIVSNLISDEIRELKNK